ncbi:MAG: hypothetical protein Q8S13_01055 [Dehalococcoidia bacterium]|nr:hypothetical protein [Dehalococcoidia bacterium]
MTALAVLIDETVPMPAIPSGYVRIQYNIPQIKGQPRHADVPTHYVYDVKLDAGCRQCWGRGLRPLPKSVPEGSIPPACGCMLRRIERVRVVQARAVVAAGGVGATPPAPTDASGIGDEERPRDRALAKVEAEITEREQARAEAIEGFAAGVRMLARERDRWAAVETDAEQDLRAAERANADLEKCIVDLQERVAWTYDAMTAAVRRVAAAQRAAEATEKPLAEAVASRDRVVARFDKLLAPLLARRDRLRRRLGKGNGV